MWWCLHKARMHESGNWGRRDRSGPSYQLITHWDIVIFFPCDFSVWWAWRYQCPREESFSQGILGAKTALWPLWDSWYRWVDGHRKDSMYRRWVSQFPGRNWVHSLQWGYTRFISFLFGGEVEKNSFIALPGKGVRLQWANVLKTVSPLEAVMSFIGTVQGAGRAQLVDTLLIGSWWVSIINFWFQQVWGSWLVGGMRLTSSIWWGFQYLVLGLNEAQS